VLHRIGEGPWRSSSQATPVAKSVLDKKFLTQWCCTRASFCGVVSLSNLATWTCPHVYEKKQTHFQMPASVDLLFQYFENATAVIDWQPCIHQNSQVWRKLAAKLLSVVAILAVALKCHCEGSNSVLLQANLKSCLEVPAKGKRFNNISIRCDEAPDIDNNSR